MILEEMFNGRFYPCETVVADSPRFKQAVKASAALMDTLSEHLSKEDYTLVEELRAQVAIAQCEENESRFKYGFSAGLLVQMCIRDRSGTGRRESVMSCNGTWGQMLRILSMRL